MSMKVSVRTLLLIGALSVSQVVHAAQGPTEDSLWYYGNRRSRARLCTRQSVSRLRHPGRLRSIGARLQLRQI
jgi:hypothetical protein